jgi:hypothetical protein
MLHAGLDLSRTRLDFDLRDACSGPGSLDSFPFCSRRRL